MNAESARPLDFLWFLPTGGDGRYLGSKLGQRVTDNRYLRQVAQAADQLGFTGALLPTGNGCEDALVTAASSVSAAWSGSYRSSNQAMLTAGNDVWPGDALLLLAPSLPVAGGGTLDTQVVVRSVKLEYGASQPDLVQYTIGFSNDWANDLAVKTSRAVAADAWLPAAVGLGYLGNLNALAVTAISATAITVAANATLPAGGGFEVRRRDFCFQAGQDPDLVLRTTTTSFDIPRATESDRFYMRMYDGNVPPNYSEFSVGLFLNLPLS